MNERFKQLAEQAGLELGIVLKDYVTPVKSITIEQRKFAELIVRECAELVKGQLTIIPEDQKDWDGHNYGYTAAVYETLDRFKEHFGVEL